MTRTAAFVHHVRPRYAEVDMQRVVFNAHWLTYFDEANTKWWVWAGLPLAGTFATGFDVMVVKAVIEWTGPAGWEEDIAITVVPARIGRSSIDFRYEAAVDERPVCSAVLTYVSVDPETHAGSCPIPERVRTLLEAHA